MLTGAEAFVASANGFATPLGNDPAAAVGRRAGLSMALPKRAEDPVRFHLLGGMQIGVREVGAAGEGSLAEGAVAYPRKGGTSFWTATADGYEEWLHLDRGVATGREPVASWEVEGATLREANGVVEIAGADGVARVRVTAPEAFADGGRAVPARLAVKDARIELWVDAGGEAVLVDPVWYAAASMGTARRLHTATRLLNTSRVLVVGGLDATGTALATAELYDEVTGLWTQAASSPQARWGHTATLLSSGKVLVVGGVDYGYYYPWSAQLYDPTANTWTSVGTTSTPRSGHTATLLSDGTVLVVGGSIPGSGGQTSVLLFNTNNTWTTKAPSTVRFRHAAARLSDGRVLVTGGYDNNDNVLSTGQIYNPSTNAWTSAASMPSGLQSHSAITLNNGKVLVVGEASAFVYDPSGNSWTNVGPLSPARSYHSATLLTDGTVLVTGGLDATAGASATTLLFNSATNAWSSGKTMLSPRIWHTSTQLASGRVLVTGGSMNPSVLASTEFLDVAADSWVSTASMIATGGRWYHTATKLQNGQVLVTGGSSNSGYLQTTEAYNPTSGTWAAKGNLTAARRAHTATLLPDGKVLVAGGYNGTVYLNNGERSTDNQATSWSTANIFSGGRAFHTATLMQNGQVILTGGLTSTGSSSSVTWYNPSTNSWTGMTSMLNARAYHTATLLPSGYVLVIGGKNGATSLASVELYNPQTNLWASKAPLLTARYGHSAMLLASGQVLVAGGVAPSPVTGAELYDPATDTWTAAGTTTDHWHGNAAALLDNGMALLTGALDANVDVYDPLHGWLTAAPMNVDRWFHTATVITGGKVLVVGGYSSTLGRPVASAEIYTPVNTNDGVSCTNDVWDPTLGQVTHTTYTCTPTNCQISSTCDGKGGCTVVNKANGTTCDDGNPNTTGDICTSGVCAGIDHCIGVTCTALDQCHDAGTCIDHATGACSNPTKTDGTACDDGNPNTVEDVCTAGLCAGIDRCIGVACTALDQCHEVGVCAPATGVCTNPLKANGMACNDGNLCTQSDTCQAGVCTGSSPVTCTALDQCHDVGTCNPTTGACSNPPKVNGTACNDGNVCTQGDTCQSGTCAGNPVTCTALDQCHDAGTCNPATGWCSNPPKANGTACTDSNACTQGDACQGGTCVAGTPVTCPTPDQCHDAGTCNPATGVCSNPAKQDGAACDDGTACTLNDYCQAGACIGHEPVTCSAIDPCHDVGTCDPVTGDCSNPSKAELGSCDDSDACTTEDTCHSNCGATSVAVSFIAKDCWLSKGYPAPGPIDLWFNGVEAQITVFERMCQDNEVIQTVTINTPEVLGALRGCSDQITVSPHIGSSPIELIWLKVDISNANGPAQSVCVFDADNSNCTEKKVFSTAFGATKATSCPSTCTGTMACFGKAKTCTALDQCHVAGVCDSATGECTNPEAEDGTVCEDDDEDTLDDACLAGTCTGTDRCVGVTCAAYDQCHVAGTCDSSTGLCTNPAVPDGTPCDDGNPNTTGEVCTSGICNCPTGAESCRTGLARADIESQRSAFGLDANYTFQLVREDTDEDGQTDVRWNQVFGGVWVEGGTAISHLDPGGGVRFITNHLLGGINVSLTPSVTLAAAITTSGLVSPTSELIILGERRLVKRNGEPLDGTESNTNDVKYDIVGYHLGWRLRDDAQEVVVDAHVAGTILASRSLARADAVGHSLYSGDRNLACYDFGAGVDVLGNERVSITDYPAETLFASTTAAFGDGLPFTNSSGVNRATEGVDAFIGVNAAWEMYDRVFNYQGLDGDGTPIDVRVHKGDCNAEWSDVFHEWIRFGDCPTLNNYPLSTVDVAAHEFTHGVDYRHSNVGGGVCFADCGEANALSEGIADIFGEMAEFYYYYYDGKVGKKKNRIPNKGGLRRAGNPCTTASDCQNGYICSAGTCKDIAGDWIHKGEVPGARLRSFINPEAYGYGSNVWSTGTNDMEMHEGGITLNRAFYFLAHGADRRLCDETYEKDPNKLADRLKKCSYSPQIYFGMTGIGNHKATRIFYRALRKYVGHSSSFEEFRDACFQAAKDLYGYGSAELGAVANAFAGIAVGDRASWYPDNGLASDQKTPAHATLGQAQQIYDGQFGHFKDIYKTVIMGDSGPNADVDYYKFTVYCGDMVQAKLWSNDYYWMDLYDQYGVHIKGDASYVQGSYKGDVTCTAPATFYIAVTSNGHPNYDPYFLFLEH